MLKKIHEFYKRNEKYKPFMFLSGICLIFMIGITIAYYSQEMNLVNTFKTMTYDVVMEEEFYDDFGVKKVTISNNDASNTPVVLRVSYGESWRNGDMVLSNTINGVNIVDKTWSQTFLDHFEYDSEDGWYYYDQLLSGNESVELLQRIDLNSTLIAAHPEYNMYNYDMFFNYEAIQASEKAILEIWGKDVTISGNDVDWHTDN